MSSRLSKQHKQTVSRSHPRVTSKKTPKRSKKPTTSSSSCRNLSSSSSSSSSSTILRLNTTTTRQFSATTTRNTTTSGETNNGASNTQQPCQQQQSLPPVPKPFIEHVFLKVEVRNNIFYNITTVSFPDHTPVAIVQEATRALVTAFKDRPDARDYAQRRLQVPEFTQSGANWNRFEWSIRQREIDGALDPLLIQTVLLDHFHNHSGAKFISSNSSTWFNRESVTHVLQFPVDALDYVGSYHDTIYDQDGCSV